MSGNRQKLIAFNYFGGKFSWLDDLYNNFPTNFIHLVDVFGGSAVVSLNYNRKVVKTYNDKYSQAVNFFKVLREQPLQLIELLELTPVAIDEYNNCWETTGNNIEDARRFFVRARQSFFALGIQRKNKGWQMAKAQLNAKGGETVSRWNNGIRKLLPVAMAIRENFQITNFDYEECINKIDFENAFFYCDPPYTKQSRKSFNDYKHEFTNKDHEKLSKKLHSIRGYAMVSGYDCELMNELYKDFRKVKFRPKKNNIRSSMVQECIWMNY